MKEKDIIYRCKAALTFAARGGLRASLFSDPVSDDADMLMQEVLKTVPQSQKPVVEQAIQEWRDSHLWLKDLPDAVQGES